MASNKFEVDSDVLRSIANKVDSASGELENQIGQFQFAIEDLSATWSSDVKERFFRSFEKDLAALREMAEQYAEVAQGLEQTAQEMDSEEEEIYSSISKAGKAVG